MRLETKAQGHKPEPTNPAPLLASEAVKRIDEAFSHPGVESAAKITKCSSNPLSSYELDDDK